MKPSKGEREELKQKYGCRCAYCGCLLGEKWHLDHIEPVVRHSKYDREKQKFVSTGQLGIPDNDCLANLTPACVPCNIDKGSNSLEGWRAYLHERIVEGLRRNSSTFRHAERFGMVRIEIAPLVFWFERYKAETREAA